MTDTAQMNGPPEGARFIDTVDPDNPEYQRELIRPAEVKEDVKQMENRKRVSLILNSQAFREELELIVESQIKIGPHPASLIALQQISDMLLPHVSANRTSTLGSGGAATPIVPINDIRGVEATAYSKGERIIRCKLASLYRLIDLFGWTHIIYNHISARITQEQEHFLINPFGMLYNEVTAASLVKVDMQGNIVDPGNTTLGVNKAGFTLHSAIHAARPDLRVALHIHHPAVIAVSIMKQGLLAISQEALALGEVSYHPYYGLVLEDEEREAIARNLGPNNKVMFLRSHGVICCGATVEEAFHYVYNVVAACETQMKVIGVGLENIVEISEDIREKTFSQMQKGVKHGGTDIKWRLGELEFEALMRHLDNTGFKTGYVYKQPVIRQPIKTERSRTDVEHPPSASSYMYDEQEGGRSPLKEALEIQKKRNKSDWLQTPNAYQKKELDETGTTTPKKFIKWEQASGDSPTQAMRTENPNQFAPQGTNPKEFKETAKSVRKGYYEERVTAGPQSKVLEGATWDDANKVQDANTSGAGDKVIIVGAASKGIISRDHQHNVTVYHSQYQQNPFAEVKDDDLEKYKQEIEHRFNPDANPSDEAVQQRPLVNGTPETNGTEKQDEDKQPEENATTKKTGSPSKSSGSASGDTLDDTSTSKEGSPTKNPNTPQPEKEKKKKKKLRFPSFSKKKDKKEKDIKEAPATEA